MIRKIYNSISPLLLLFKWRKIDSERFQIPKFERKKNKNLFWIHAVSVGETKAATPFAIALKKRDPKAQIVISCGTKTGLAEAKKSLPELDAHFRLPLDATWLMKPLVKLFNPNHFFLVETDLWPNLLYFLKKNGTTCSLINAKMSDKSYRRYKLFPIFARSQMGYFDHICLQSESYRKCFAPYFSGELLVTGNLKWDALAIKTFPKEKEFTITLGSTHPGEERLLLEALKDFPAKIYVVPRHPQRFSEVRKLVKNYPKALLVDQMGVLCDYYAKSQIAIVGGSFLPGIGGHNIFEPLAYGTPVIFGPHMSGQEEMARLAKKSGAGRQCEAEELVMEIKKLEGKGEAGQTLLRSLQGPTKKTLSLVRK
ncbi:MAG: glycosyltransferase N-terminal domain-containing protein [Candidatus Algichlamydia australiensis]|nr:glycosyltransferase N-terminal domain-containing protein [Chlamydiales bacterium]